jgi:3-oxoacyl-[acyl-carrier protein] reductase
MKLYDKVALVTGGGQGIGESIVMALAKEGADIIINDIESNIDKANRVAGEVNKLGQKAVAVVADVAKSDEVAKMVHSGLREFKKIDILVNNAGISRPAILGKMTDAQWDEVLNVNLKGVFNCCRAVIANMIENKWGRIVTISSLGAKSGTIGLSAYSASKAGCIGLTKSLAKELARHQILVNAVLPGYIETSIQKAPAKYRETVINECPLKRAGKPEEVAAVVAFLASPDASYITGAAIEVGGGLWL